MTHQRTLTTAHWGVYEVEYDDAGQAVRLHPFSKDPDPSPIGLHMLSDEVARLRVRRPAVRKSWLEHGPGANSDKRGQEPFVEVSWDEALDLVAGELTRVKDAAHQPRDLRRLLRLVERRPLPPRPEPGPSLPERDRRLCAPPGFLQPGRGARADAAHRGDDGRADVHAHGWDVLAEHCKLFVTFGGVPHKNAQINAGGATLHHVKGGLYAHARRGRALRQRHADRRGSRHRRRRRMAGDPAQHRCRDDPGALPHAARREALRPRVPRPLHRGLRQVRALPRRDDGRQPNGPRRSPAFRRRRIVALAREMAATRTTVSINWSLQRAHHGEQPFWALITLACMLGQIGLPGGGFGVGYGPVNLMGSAHPAIFRPDPAAGHQRGHRLHPGRALHRHAAQSRRQGFLQRPGPHLSRHPPGLLGGRQSVPPSPGPQPPDGGVAQARDDRLPRAVLDAGRAHGRHRAAGDDHARARRHRLRQPRAVPDRHEEGARADRRGARRLRDLLGARPPPRPGRCLHRGPRHDGVAAASLRAVAREVGRGRRHHSRRSRTSGKPASPRPRARTASR